MPTRRKCRCLHLHRALLWPHTPRSQLLNYFDRQMATLKWFLALALGACHSAAAGPTTTLVNCQSACNLGEMLCLSKNASATLCSAMGEDYAPAPPASPPALLLPETRDRASTI